MNYFNWADSLSLEEIEKLFIDSACDRVLVKQLSPKQDNSKNQVYMGGDISQLSVLPMGKAEESSSTSRKTKSGKTIKITIPVPLLWMTASGDMPARDAKLIFYPQYPEVRLSGFLNGVQHGPNQIMGGRETSVPGRLLLLGPTPDGNVKSIALPAGAMATEDILNHCGETTYGAFREWKLRGAPRSKLRGRELLLESLKKISEMGWVEGQKFVGSEVVPYQAINAGGVTLETLLGIKANSYSEPDFEGFELKVIPAGKKNHAVTLLTPEPTGGIYRDDFTQFKADFFYPSEKDATRMNFGGVYTIGRDYHHKTGLKLVLHGWDGEEIGINPLLALVDVGGAIAASWKVSDLVDHWVRKHAKACYVPYEKRVDPVRGTLYRYLPTVQLYAGATFKNFLNGFQQELIYLDPALKTSKINAFKDKKRNQFRTKVQDLSVLYESECTLDVSDIISN